MNHTPKVTTNKQRATVCLCLFVQPPRQDQIVFPRLTLHVTVANGVASVSKLLVIRNLEIIVEAGPIRFSGRCPVTDDLINLGLIRRSCRVECPIYEPFGYFCMALRGSFNRLNTYPDGLMAKSFD